MGQKKTVGLRNKVVDPVYDFQAKLSGVQVN